MRFPSLPLLSDEDKPEASEGGLDPLGLEQISDALADKLVPSVRERMSHPRYLTAMAVGMEVCRRFVEDTVAKDGISEPWQVYEWLAVEGLVRTKDGDDSFKLPGSEKVATALRERLPLSAARYLKTPAVFGFHGVYRRLARGLDVDSAGRLGEVGHELLTTWVKEQGLDGFVGTAGGEGARMCDQLYAAVNDSLSKGAVDRGDGWQGWSFFRRYLSPDKIGRRESEVIRRALLASAAGLRGEVLRFLVSPEGKKVYSDTGSERHFHETLRKGASAELVMLLDAIERYETFSRLCQDAFDDVLVELTRRGASKVTPRQLAEIKSVRRASARVPELFDELLERLEPYRETVRFAQAFATLAERTDPTGWVDRLFGHHVLIQRRKPPLGKNPWFERFDDGGVIIRPLYRRDQPSAGDDRYVHGYRTWPLSRFAADLHMVPT